MRIVTKEYRVYQFNELSDDVKERVIEKWYEHEDYPFLGDDIKGELEQLDKHGIFSEVELMYSLSCCQGDGLCFKASIDFDKFIQRLSNVKIGGMRLRAVIEYVYDVFSVGNTGHYSYAHENQIEWNPNYSGRSLPRLERHTEAIIKEIKVYYLDICEKLEKYGYGIIEHRMNNEEFQENCDANDYEFLENGERF